MKVKTSVSFFISFSALNEKIRTASESLKRAESFRILYLLQYASPAFNLLVKGTNTGKPDALIFRIRIGHRYWLKFHLLLSFAWRYAMCEVSFCSRRLGNLNSTQLLQFLLNASWLEFASARRRTTLILLKVPDGFQILWNSNFAALHFITAIATPLQPGKLSRCDFYWCGIDFLTSSQVFSHARIFDNPSQGCSLSAARGIWPSPAEGSSQSTEAVAQRFTSSDTTCWDEKYNWAHSFLINRSVAACCREARGGGHWIMTCSGTALPGQTGYDGLCTRAEEPQATCTLWHLDVVADVGPVGVLLSYRPCLSQRKAIHTRQTRASAHEASMVTFSRMGAKNIRDSWRHDLQRRTWPSAHFLTWSRRSFSKSSRVIDAINTKLEKQQTQGFQIVPWRKKHIG